MEMTKEVLAAILDAYPYEVVYVDRTHTIRYLNKAAQEKYGKIIHVGGSLFSCHNEKACAKIEIMLAQADADPECGEIFEVLNQSTGEREFFVPVRDSSGAVIGYFERHENYWSKDDPTAPVEAFSI